MENIIIVVKYLNKMLKSTDNFTNILAQNHTNYAF